MIRKTILILLRVLVHGMVIPVVVSVILWFITTVILKQWGMIETTSPSVSIVTTLAYFLLTVVFYIFCILYFVAQRKILRIILLWSFALLPPLVFMIFSLIERDPYYDIYMAIGSFLLNASYYFIFFSAEQIFNSYKK